MLLIQFHLHVKFNDSSFLTISYKIRYVTHTSHDKCKKMHLTTCPFYHYLSSWSLLNEKEYSEDNWDSFYSHIIQCELSYSALLEWYNKISTLSLQGNMTMRNLQHIYKYRLTASVPISHIPLSNKNTIITYKNNNESSHCPLRPFRWRLLCTYARWRTRRSMDIIQKYLWKTIQFSRRRSYSVCYIIFRLLIV